MCDVICAVTLGYARCGGKTLELDSEGHRWALANQQTTGDVFISYFTPGLWRVKSSVRLQN